MNKITFIYIERSPW